MVASTASNVSAGRQWVDQLLESCPEAADFRCPLSHVIMLDPVVAEDGCTYERLAIEEWLKTRDTSPMVREASTDEDGRRFQAFRPMGKELVPNHERKAALDKLVRDFDLDGEDYLAPTETVKWDAHLLQTLLPQPRSVTLSSPMMVVPPPAQHPDAVADITSDLIKMFKVLDPLRGELQAHNLTPPKVVVIGDESAGKSTVLEQLIRMPLFPRKKTFCTRLPIHVRLRRPDPARGETPVVTMSVVSTEDYRRHGHDAPPKEPPCVIATASGFAFVQDKMDELERSLAGATGGVVADRIIVLDVLHPEVPVIDLIDLPGIVTVNVTAEDKREAVESVIGSQIEADRAAGHTSFYLVVVPAGERPNTNGALKYIQSQGLLERAIGVFTKADEVRRPDDLVAFITGEDFEDEDDGTVVTAASLGEVKLSKGWTATMLAMPKRFVVKDGSTKVNYYAVHATERLKKQEDDEKNFFGGSAAKPVMRDLYDRGLAGTGALAAKLTREYFEYSRSEWLPVTLAKLLEHELSLKSERSLLGATDPEVQDELAAEEVAKTLDDGAQLLVERFVHELQGSLLVDEVSAAVNELLKEPSVDAADLDDTLHEMRATIESIVASAVERVSTFFTAEITKMLSAPIRACAPNVDESVQAVPAQGPLSARFWALDDWSTTCGEGAGLKAKAKLLFRSLFGTTTRAMEGIELHQQVIAQPIVQLGQFPAFVDAVSQTVQAECLRASEKIRAAAAKVTEQLTDDASHYVCCAPTNGCKKIEVRFHESPIASNHTRGGTVFEDALLTAFVRYLPTPAKLKAAVGNNKQLRLSTFEEDAAATNERCKLNERIERVRDVAKGLVAALDVDASKPLDGTWLRELQEEKGLPTDDPIIQYVPPPAEPEESPRAV